MVLSYYFIRPVYSFTWRVIKIFRRKKKNILYCEDALDAELFKNVRKHLGNLDLVAKNKNVLQKLRELGYKGTVMPSFPDSVIMFRNMAWKFPCKKIKKIGFKHGIYSFKRQSKAQYFNLFDVFFMTSDADRKEAEKIGVKTAETIGCPKIDGAFDGSITREQLKSLVNTIGLNPLKKTLLFSATWDGSGMSAIEKWYDRVGELKEKYNILVTLHVWMSDKYVDVLKNTPGVYLIKEYEILKYIMISDVCIGDTSSIIAEFCALDKPIVTFTVKDAPRVVNEVKELINKISVQINSFDELEAALSIVEQRNDHYYQARKEATKTFLGSPDGYAGLRAAQRIIELVPELAIK
ncbi:CDP-glycerol glycerophosphotransferase family protein [Chitinispirillales bacterium ANBcel5]|uniref:CDP-glycerol glycerophosphotransferase family protein n=1 Tax=Cellulosispirillum alkaliphilum TaxID=3039283 RepID=UPI002A5081C5|nr:CDP-glycerol glycerophosphotransferase family protein [Chitinispirillales bacterium ANBcel5]